MMVATTTNANRISPTQNYSSRFVDFGVLADLITPTFMKFKAPLVDELYISGSSFVTAILTDKIDALASKSAYRAGLNKQDIITNINSGGSGVIRTSTRLKNRTLARDGRYFKRE